MKGRRLFSLFLMALGGLGFLFFLALSLHLVPLSITETSCSSDGVWLKFNFMDEPNIPKCFIGEISCIGKSPTGKIVQFGGYTATTNSTQKINCDPSGKSFVANYVPVDGQGGDYSITCSGKDDSTGKTFTVTRSVFASCPTFQSQCADGTPTQTCSKNKPYYCDKYGYLTPSPTRCGCSDGTYYLKEDGVCGKCPSGTIYNSASQVCEQIEVQDKCAGQPTSCQSGQHISKDTNGCNICVANQIQDPYPNQTSTSSNKSSGQTTIQQTSTNPLSQYLRGLTGDQIKILAGVSGVLFLIGLYGYRR